MRQHKIWYDVDDGPKRPPPWTYHRCRYCDNPCSVKYDKGADIWICSACGRVDIPRMRKK